VPLRYPPTHSLTHSLILRESFELSLFTGTRVQLLKRGEEVMCPGWWLGTFQGKRGVFPASCIAVIDPTTGQPAAGAKAAQPRQISVPSTTVVRAPYAQEPKGPSAAMVDTGAAIGPGYSVLALQQDQISPRASGAGTGAGVAAPPPVRRDTKPAISRATKPAPESGTAQETPQEAAPATGSGSRATLTSSQRVEPIGYAKVAWLCTLFRGARR